MTEPGQPNAAAEPNRLPGGREDNRPNPESGRSDDEPSVLLAAEQLIASTERVVSGRVRVHRRVVSETRTMDVEVHREELVIEGHDITPGAVGESYRGTALDGAPVSDPTPLRAGPLVVLLREEIPEIVIHRQVYEQVTVDVVTVDEIAVRHDTVRREEAAATTTSGPALERPDRSR